MFDHPSQMEPLFPTLDRARLRDRAVEVIRRAAALGARLHPAVARALAEFLRQMNSYYSNLIEGHRTSPLDIERALAQDFAADPARRELQLESRAHVEAQALIERRLAGDPSTPICGAEFLCWIHGELYRRMPDEFRVIENHPVEPGALRDRDLQVGRHVAPAHGALVRFLERFAEAYEPTRLGPLDRVVALAAAHHRLAWIHPFLDGNGRVARLFTHAYAIRAGIEAHGLWTLARGFARQRPRYLDALASADAPRQGDLDGRGNLSDAGLGRFCEFVIEVALDQIAFMDELLDLDGLLRRVEGTVARRAAARELRTEAAPVLAELIRRGTLARGEVARVAGLRERTARLLIRQLLDEGLVKSDSPKGALRIAFPMRAAASYFPRLAPEE